jgi:hypothetical protein
MLSACGQTAVTRYAFPADERRLLLSVPRIGERVVARIEAHGIHSLRALQQCGVDRLVDRICREQGSPAWANRRSALTQALNAAISRRIAD